MSSAISNNIARAAIDIVNNQEKTHLQKKRVADQGTYRHPCRFRDVRASMLSAQQGCLISRWRATATGFSSQGQFQDGWPIGGPGVSIRIGKSCRCFSMQTVYGRILLFRTFADV